MTLRRVSQVLGVLGGIAWVVYYFATDDASDPLARGLFWGGVVLITVALMELGMMLVKRGVVALRVFVACVLPLFFWMVVSFVVPAAADEALAYAVVGAVVALLFLLLLAQRGPQRATL
jgi:hypothetical protein